MPLPKKLASFIWFFIKRQKPYFITIQLTSLAWSLDNTVWPYALKLLIDKIIAFTGDKSAIWIYLIPVLMFWAALWLLIEILFRVQGFVIARTTPQFQSDVRMAMFAYVSGHSYDFFANHFAGSVANKISDMTQSATRILEIIMTLIIPAFVALLIAGAIFFTINHWFAILLIGWVVLHIGICFLGARRCTTRSNHHAQARSALTGRIVDSFTNIINVKLFAKEHYEYEHIQRYQTVERQKQRAALFLIEKVKIALGFSALIIPGVLMTWYIIYSWQHDLVSIGEVVLIFNTTWNIQLLAWYVGLELPNLFQEIGICQQALDIIQAKHDITDKLGARNLVIKNGGIVFDRVTFQYTQGSRVFDNLSINIAASSKVGLVGFSGGGKSSFVNLIMRFFDIESGHIRIDGMDICDATVSSLRSQISMIPQDPTLFHRTLWDNIRYGKMDASKDEIIAAAKHAHCHDFICALPNGYDSLVGERGIKLSGGQRQRIAIARAILDNAPILILDEATSALDSVTEKHIQSALHYLMQDKTTIVIAHRLSTLAQMDRLLVFDQGKIVEDGTHQSLLRAGGHYATLWRMQAGGFLPDKPQEEGNTA